MGALSPGFADPVTGSQTVFRAVLDALSSPGSVHPVGEGFAPPAALLPATALVLLTLVDPETPLHIAPDLADAAEWLSFHCGAPLVPADQARFVLAASLPDLATLEAGRDEEPEDSATVILQVAALTGGRRRWRLSGPGLAASVEFAPVGLPETFVRSWDANHRRFPCGVDVILCAPTAIAALPRSVRIVEDN